MTLRIYTRHVTAAEEKRIISNAANKNRMQRNSTNDLQQTVAAESNLQDVARGNNSLELLPKHIPTARHNAHKAMLLS